MVRSMFDRTTPLVFGWFAAIAGCYGGAGGADAGTEGPQTGSPESTGAPTGTGETPTGTGEEPTGDETGTTPVDPCEQQAAGHSPLRRLTRSQYNNTIKDLFLLGGDPSSSFVPDDRIGAFYMNNRTPVSELDIEEFLNAAEAVARAAVAEKLDVILPCDPQEDGAEECAEQFITEFGRRLYRRPLTADEIGRLAAVFAVGAEDSFELGLELTLQVMLQSPNFLYVPQYGGAPEGAVAQLDGYEIAARLSFFLWNTTPDDELLGMAESGALATAEGVRAQAERMLDNPRARRAIESFALQWLHVDDLPDHDKDDAIYPAWDKALAESMVDELAHYADWVIREGDGSFQTLMTSNSTLAEGPLLELLGGVAPEGHEPGDPIALDPARMHGILTHPAVMARHAYADQSSPIYRGATVLEAVLCQPMPAAPADFMVEPPKVDLDVPTRERFEMHSSIPECAGCHAPIDGIGFGFENYDGIGLFRAEDAGVPVDASADVKSLNDAALNKLYPGPVEMIDAMTASEQVRGCFVKQWTRFALMRVEQDEDQCSLDHLNAGFAADGLDIRELLLTMVTTDMFRYRRVEE